MNDFLIKIKIADREYPLRIQPEDEPMLKEAARKLQKSMDESSERTGITDKQDLLAMAAFDLVVKALKQNKEDQDIRGKLMELERDVTQILQEA